jgi:hypothetical protein
MLKKYPIIFLLLILASSNIYGNNTDTLKYIFIGHSRSTDGVYDIDYRIANIDFSLFDRVWIGGDASIESCLHYSTITYLDSLFGLGKPSTQFSLGNHDIRQGNIIWYHEKTKKASYNVYSNNNVVSICLNTMLNPSNCEQLNAQFYMLTNVLDTIEETKHLFVFNHHGIWGPIEGVSDINNSCYCHTKLWNFNFSCDSNQTTFQHIVYPKLVDLVQSGVNVYCILGDTGSQIKSFHAESTDGVHFFSNGIERNTETEENPDTYLLFKYVPETNQMSWEFVPLGN